MAYAEQTGALQCCQGRGIGPDKESDWVVTLMQNRQGSHSVVKGRGQAQKESDWVVIHMQNRQGSHNVVKGGGQTPVGSLTGR